MHLIVMLILVLLGLIAGEKVSWLLGLPIMGLGLLMFEVGGKKAKGWRQDQEDLFSLLGLISMVLIIIISALN